MRNDHAVVDINSGIYRVAAWAGVALQAVGFVAVLLLERWYGAISLAVFLVGSTAFLSVRNRLPSLLDLLIVAAALVNVAGWAGNLFPKVTFYDDIVHAFTSFAIIAALAYIVWVPTRAGVPVLTSSRLLKAVAGGLLLGVLWEAAEAIFLTLEWVDTLVDLLMDTIGAAVAAPFAVWAVRQKNRGYT